MSGLSPSLSFDAFAATVAQLDGLDEQFIGLLVHTDLLVAEGYEVTNETKQTLIRIVMLLRSLRQELVAVTQAYRVLRRDPKRALSEEAS